MKFRMTQTMRWHGPNDVVSLADIRQAGCSGVVSALHQIPVGEVWTREAIQERKSMIEAHGLDWKVVESLPVHDDIKRQTGDYKLFIENYKTSIVNLAEEGIKVITYNFMPVLDWLRTHPNFTLPDGARTLRFEKDAFVSFDVFLLKRPGAESDYTEQEISAATTYYNKLSEEERKKLFDDMMLGLPGSDEKFTPELVLSELEKYAHIDTQLLKKHLSDFLNGIIPVAEKHGIAFAIHPDDPPVSVLGLPRIVSTEQDLADIISFIDSPANGLCFCTGSLGARKDNDLLKMLQRFGDQVHFLHLRNTKMDDYGNFQEAEHLNGDADMPAIVKEALHIMDRRQLSIPMRPDHGFQMLDDLKKTTYPGYSAIGRLKALAELRGLEVGILHSME